MICVQNRDNCNFIANGHCTILHDTHFKRACPFFKPKVKACPRDYEFIGHIGNFRLIDGFDGRYFVSEYGEVINRKGETMSRKYDKYGCPVMCLRLPNGKQTTARVARLVANAFLPGAEPVENIDGDPDNCELTNLRRMR